MTAEERAEYIRAIVAQAPPLDARQAGIVRAAFAQSPAPAPKRRRAPSREAQGASHLEMRMESANHNVAGPSDIDPRSPRASTPAGAR